MDNLRNVIIAVLLVFMGIVAAVATPSTTQPPSSILEGTPTNDNAPAGNIGEFVTASASTVSLSNASPKTITSVSLTAGDWDCNGGTDFNPAGSTTVSVVEVGISQTTNTLPSTPDPSFARIVATLTTGAVQSLPAGTVRESLSMTTSVFLVVQANFGNSTMTADAVLRCRRVR